VAHGFAKCKPVMHATQQLCCEPLIEVGVKSVKVWRKEAEEVAYDLSDNDDLYVHYPGSALLFILRNLHNN